MGNTNGVPLSAETFGLFLSSYAMSVGFESAISAFMGSVVFALYKEELPIFRRFTCWAVSFTLGLVLSGNLHDLLLQYLPSLRNSQPLIAFVVSALSLHTLDYLLHTTSWLSAFTRKGDQP